MISMRMLKFQLLRVLFLAYMIPVCSIAMAVILVRSTRAENFL